MLTTRLFARSFPTLRIAPAAVIAVTSIQENPEADPFRSERNLGPRSKIRAAPNLCSKMEKK